MTKIKVDLVTAMREGAAQATAVLRALANEDRLLLLCAMREGERCVGQLEEAVAIHQPTLSQQLGVLRREGLVRTRRSGKQIYYTVANPNVVAMLDTLHTLFCPVR